MHWRCKISRLREEQMVASQCDLEASKEQLTLTRARYKIGELNLSHWRNKIYEIICVEVAQTRQECELEHLRALELE